MLETIKGKIQSLINLENDSEKKMEYIAELKQAIHECSPVRTQPVDYVKWIHISKVQANDYNPNAVASKEMQLLHTSIKHDGYTQPVVTVYDPEIEKYVIVDGFHRYFCMKTQQDLQESTNSYLPCVVIEKDINDRMASTVRHNRARGKHSVTGMSNMVFTMLENGWEDPEICNELGMEPDELLRIKHLTGFSKLFENVEYRQAWLTRRQVKLAVEHGVEAI